MAPITQPQEILPTEAAIASAMTISAAIGVAIVRVKFKRELAPVLKGDDCATATAGTKDATAHSHRTIKRSRPSFFVLLI